jgi:hypothetical protein
MGGNRLLTLAFLRPLPEDPLENRVAAALSAHGVCHAELVFDDGAAFSIVQGGTAGLRPRTLGNPNYETVTLSVSSGEYAACLRFCQDAQARGLGFDTLGMYMCLVHPRCMHRASLDTGRTFCSKIITEALQHASVAEAEGLVPSATTPSGLYSAVRGSQRRMCHTVRRAVRFAPNFMPRPPGGA